jgi:hypothetical protein
MAAETAFLRRWGRGFALGALAWLAACEGYPRDPGETTARVRDSGVIRVGIDAAADEGTALALARRIAEAAGAEAQARRGAAEPLFRGLEHGEIDLVIAEIAADSPWSSRVYFLPSQRPDDAPVLRPVVRNGENAWIMLVDEVYRP